MTGNLWTVGQPAPLALLDLPGLSWHVAAQTLVLVVPSDDPDLAEAAAGADVWLGVLQAGPVPIVLARFRDDSGHVLGYWEAPGAWRTGDDPPEVTVSDAEHMAWTLLVVEGSPGYQRDRWEPRPMTVTGLRAFTTSPAFTRAMRRAQAEQRAAGPMDEGQVLEHMRGYYAANDAGRDAWRRCIVTSRAGE